MLKNLGYVGIDATDLEAWRQFGTRILGLSEIEVNDDTELRFKLDDRTWRIAVHSSERDGLRYVGFEVSDAASLRRLALDLERSGGEVHYASQAERAERGVADLVVTQDPSGNVLELFCGQECDYDFTSPLGTRFVTGDLGLGHVVLVATAYRECIDFYTDILGFRVSDYFKSGPADLTFLHSGPRHHSLALANGGTCPEGEQPTFVTSFADALAAMSAPNGCAVGFLHFMLEVEDFDEVGHGLERAQQHGVPITQSLGRHSNDRMFSFYMETPGGFEVEYGWGGVIVDDETWTVTTMTKPSLWGHHLRGERELESWS